jgi:hypothetical protein
MPRQKFFGLCFENLFLIGQSGGSGRGIWHFCLFQVSTVHRCFRE